ncbi:hypothetical protein BABINDRAFT_59306 [Babjeviella inositovora NRRL Y-12698]|uniref:Uncharacterized protein n=1 Tax=Babjeviella inositovora NRRL Y-12698 TaxID=984486 RepID=A0A1E3QT73_9ASCO|nr:uncharacterized protein BABINDRAFT_59306 [Babjeviella inositovora NRRL Y-12698]ODQ80905.1 hypothetical protein BABINDRAFT_59306 [Babjeviella inositovora NRRL Y-12698]
MSEDLATKVAFLESLVKRQSELLSQTGQQVLALTVKQTKGQIEDLQPPAIPGVVVPNIDTSDFVVNDDIVQLVSELQGQLDNLETRSIRRGVNILKSDDDAVLAPMLNNDGVEPPKELWPATLGVFKTFDKNHILELSAFYDLLPPLKAEQDRMQAFMEGDLSGLSEQELANGLENLNVEPSAEDYNEEEVDTFFDDLARYIGVTARRTPAAW